MFNYAFFRKTDKFHSLCNKSNATIRYRVNAIKKKLLWINVRYDIATNFVYMDLKMCF